MSVESQAYRVLARKYRPQTLSALVGQDLLVKTLGQAFRQNRLPHAFVLHGIRGVGKTTTARILAKSLNCLALGESEQVDPCGQCTSCLSILDDRHLDVVEMDAASHTGVDDIREIIESSKYKAVHGRYKIYIIDEVHMLSRSAFNALLKTLEEPPPHVKFIFATTEINKIPDTVLSRCMRFDLARISPPVLMGHLKKICEQESVIVEEEALSLLVRAADGSARDGLSLLDQAIAVCGQTLQAQDIRHMLGLMDRERVFRLFTFLMEGKAPEVLGEVRDMLERGGDPLALVQELLDLTYWVTSLKAAPQLKNDATWPLSDREQGVALGTRLSLPVLMRAWQILSKGYEEVTRSPMPNQALEMVLLRLVYISPFPSAEDLFKLTQGLPKETDAAAFAAPVFPENMENKPASPVQETHTASPATYQDLLTLVAQKREPTLYSILMQDVHLVSFNPQRLELRLSPRAPKTLVDELKTFLLAHTGTPWEVILCQEGGQETLVEQRKQQALAEEKACLEHPVVKEILSEIPGTEAKVILNT